MNTKAEAKTYIWRGKDKAGKIRKNEVVAINESLVRTYLQKQGITPISVAEKPKALYESKGSINAKNIVSFTRQMATMLTAGMSVTKALSLVADGIVKPVKMREMVQDIQAEIEGGSSLSKSLGKYPVYFNDLYVSLVTAGEEAGTLDDTLDKIAENLEKSEAIKKKIKKALTYPIMVVIAAIIVTGVLLVKVIPIFEDFFNSFDAELPMITQMVVKFSEAARTWGWMIPVGLGIFIFIFIWYKKRNRKFQRNVNVWSFKMPLLGGILKLGAMARFSRTLSVLFESGVPLVKALNATSGATGSVIYEEAVLDIAKDIENGAQLNFAMQTTGKFDSFSVQMVGIGEESGNLGEMLGNVANYYEEELDYKIDNLTTMIEPIIISFLAVVIGTLVIAMYMPIFMLGDIVG